MKNNQNMPEREIKSQNNKKKYDLIPLYGDSEIEEENIFKDGFNLKAISGITRISNTNYFRVGLMPGFYTKFFKLKFNLDGYVFIYRVFA